MVIASHNKASYFALKIEYINLEYDNIDTKSHDRDISESMDLVFDRCRVNNKIYKFREGEDNKLIYLFSTRERKRKGQVTKIISNTLKNDIIKRTCVIPLMKTEFNEYIQKNDSNNQNKAINMSDGEYSRR